VRVVITLTLRGWALMELGLIVRDWMRGRGCTARDRGTRRQIAAAWIVAYVSASLVADALRHDRMWGLGRGHLLAGAMVVWLGLALRVWSIVMLGGAWRTTVAMEPWDSLVERGPYRWIRHPSYTGFLIAAFGLGLMLGNWISLAIVVLLPLAALLRRISVEEAVMAEVLGHHYAAYRARTRCLLPGVW
jgi:protein-S-isoprenylcysteine O-methyltransferase Ste14